MEILYHYCPTESFCSIIRSRELWLSSLSLSNDIMEGKVVAEAMSSVAAKDGLGSDEINQLQNRIRIYNEIIDGLSFCFSPQRDLLSQWRGYAANGSGVALGFSRDYLVARCRALTESRADAAFTINDVEYDSDRHEFLVRETYEKIKPHIQDGVFRSPLHTILSTGDPDYEQKNMAFETLQQDLDNELFSLVNLLFLLKSPAFKEEQEVRLLSYLVRNDESNCDHRALHDRLIPYRRFELSLENNPIFEIILGPKHVTSPWTVKEFLRRNGYGDIRVERSKASYR